jgi:DNA helicase-2/ATP-dependent DNA helicase PcrA
MSIPAITPSDLAELKSLAPGLDFTDAERQAVLLAADTCDINAAPGSGKTTVLAAKLLLHARKWPYDQRGICVLSHTTVARDEIQKRLGATAQGARLLAYPHFIGTIHSFVDRFLALPALRSLGLSVDVIDNDVFAKRAIALAMKNSSIWGWAQKNAAVKPLIGGLVLQGPNLELGTEEGVLPKTTAKTYSILQAVKLQLVEAGVFRFADMFAFAEYLLAKYPDINEHVSRRFPLVYIDEMQDTSMEQEALLDKLFNASVLVQRFGDVNQRILGSGADPSKLSFPGADALPISSSKRFGPTIASAVSTVRVGGAAVTGAAVDVHPPMLLMYAAARVGEVVGRFAHCVLDRFDDAALQKSSVKALCARKQGNAATQEPGRTLLDYWPAYLEQSKGGGRPERLWTLLSQPAEAKLREGSMYSRAIDVKRATLLVLRAVKSPHVEGVRDGSQLVRRLTDAGQDSTAVVQLFHTLALATDLDGSDDGRARAVAIFYRYLHPLFPAEMTLAKFQALPVFAPPEKEPEQEVGQQRCRVTKDGRSVEVEIGTVASMKGETHLATLVLESLGYPSRRFDLQEALPVLAGLDARDPKMKESVLSQFRSLYVGMSRPSSFLCLAVNQARVSADCVAALQQQGWVIETLY